jgi:hypothetical protein
MKEKLFKKKSGPPKGYKHTKEALLKISLAGKGRTPWCKGKKLSEETKKKMSDVRNGSKHWNYGKKASKQTISKLKESHLGQKAWNKGKKMPEISGDKHPHWKGGITPINLKIRASLEYKLWRQAVFERDNYTCIWCGDSKGGNLEADHIKPFALFPELRLAIDNGRTLCKNCHRKTDTWGGKIKTYVQ